MQKLVAIVVGGTSGVGLELVKILAQEKISVVVIGRNPKELKLLPLNIRRKTSFFGCDVTNWEEFAELSQRIAGNTGRINYLVNCQGFSATQDKGNKDIVLFEKLLKINLSSVYYSCALFKDAIVPGGSIVNISSIRGRTGTDSGSLGYAASKAGVINLTKSLAGELAQFKIRVNCVAPGPIYPTGISKNWSLDFRTEMIRKIPLGKISTPREVAETIRYLLCIEKNMTGCTLDINGGLWSN